MTDDWTERSLYSLGTYQNGRPFRSDETRGKAGLPIIKIAELNRGITESTGWFEGELEERHAIRSGDLLFSWSGTIVIRRWVDGPAALNQHLFRVTPADDVDGAFLEYLLQSQAPVFERIVLDQRTTMGHVKVSDLKDIRIQLPPVDEQRRIGRLIRALDRRSDANKQLVVALEALIVSRLDRAQLAGFEWPVRPLSSLGRFVNGGAYTKGASGTGRIVIRIREINMGPGDSTVYSDIRVPADQEANPGDILFPWSGSLGVYRWNGPNAIVNQHIFKVVPTGAPAWFLFARLQQAMAEFRAIARDKATTMGHIQRHDLDLPVEVPPPDRLAALDEDLAPAWRMILAAEAELLHLAAVRAEAVPLLVSGAISAGGVDRAPSEAAG